jgi:signal recognition particle receptor subunit beta
LELKHRDRIVQVKIVYYGPAVGGKTTNLQMLHSAAEKRHRGEFISVNSAQDRTILFDLLPLGGVGFHGFEVRFQVVAVPGQAAFAATRRLVLRGADGVVFVANSARDRLQDNVVSIREMTDHLVANQIDPGTVPIVFQYNKRDLPDISSLDALEEAVNFREAPYRPAVAIRGEGVLECLGVVLEETMGYLMGRYRALALGEGETVSAWTREMLLRVFGRTSIARGEPLPKPAPEGEHRRIVRVAVPRVRVATPEKPPEGGNGSPAAAAPPPPPSPGIAESYAQASLDLSQALERMRYERDEARRRLEELERALAAIQALEEGRPAGEALRDALDRMVVGGGCRAATLLGAAPDRALRLVTSVGIVDDPFLRLQGGERVVRQRFIPLKSPLLVNPAKTPEVAAAVMPLHPPVKAVVAVPVRSALGLHGLAILYYGLTDPLPSAAVLAHLGHMGRVLASWFSVRRAAAFRSTADTIRRTLPQIERAARSAGQLVREATRNPSVAAPALEKAGRTLDAVAALAADLLEGGGGTAKAPDPRG